MAQSTTNLGKIHVFPSETLYNQFKDIIADNDLALLKDDGAYIVAALLEQNGYVKFSNGLILQWGVADNGAAAQNWSKTITLPIAFSNPNYIVAGSATIIDGIYVLFTHSNKTTSSVLIFASGCWSGNTSRYANWFALGY